MPLDRTYMHACIQVKASEETLLDRASRLAAALAAKHACTVLPTPMTRLTDDRPTSQMDAGLVDCMHDAAAATVGDANVVATRSAAVHAASSLAQAMPTAMLAVPDADTSVGQGQG